MLPEIGASELLVIAIVALLVVGPKDLPVLMRKVGNFLNRMRGMAAEFRASFDEMARQSELDDLRKEVEALRKGHTDEMRAFKSETDDLVYDIDRGVRGYDDAQPTPTPAPATDGDPPLSHDAPTESFVPDAPLPSHAPPEAAEPAPAPPRRTRARKTAG